METIHQISDFKYVSKVSGKYKSKKQIVYEHIRYIQKTATATLGDKQKIIDNVELLDKRYDSRVLLKFHIAIPRTSKEDAKEWLHILDRYIKEQLKVNDVFLALHYNENNPHIHVAISPRTVDGKALRVQPGDLRRFHQNWKELLEKRGYSIKKYEDSIYFDRRVEYDNEYRELMKEYRQAQRELYEIKKSLPNYSQSEPEPVRATRQPEPQRTEPVHKEPEPTRTLKPEPRQPIPPKQEYKEQDKEFAMRLSVASTTDRKPHPTEFVEREIRTLSELKSVIRSSYYSNIIWDTGYRSSKNAKGVSNFLVFDVDGTDTIERVYRTLKEKNIRAILTTTKSHTEQEHHFRIIIKTNRELQETELLYFKQLMKLIMKDLELNADTSAFDLARMYAAHPKATFFFVDGKELNIDGYIQQAKELYEFEMQQTFTKQVSYKQKKQEQHWIYVDFDALVNVDIEDLIDHFETITKRWKEGNQIYLKTQKGNKYDINKEWNVCYNFYDAKGYGVISYLQEQLNTTHLLNIATYLERNSLATGLLVLNEKIFNEKLGRCIDKAWNMDEFLEKVKQEFNVKSVFLDLDNRTIKIGQFKIELDDEMHEKLVDAFVPQKRSPGRSPGL